MIQSFAGAGMAGIFDGRNTKEARKTCSHELWRMAARKMEPLGSVGLLEELRIPQGIAPRLYQRIEETSCGTSRPHAEHPTGTGMQGVRHC